MEPLISDAILAELKVTRLFLCIKFPLFSQLPPIVIAFPNASNVAEDIVKLFWTSKVAFSDIVAPLLYFTL